MHDLTIASSTKRITATLLVAGLLWSAEHAIGQQTAKVGSRAPDFKVKDLNGKEFKSSELAGSVVVLDLWATWCEPCIDDIPIFNRLHERYGSRGLQVVGVAVESGWAQDIKPHVAKHGIKYTVLVGDQKVVEQYQLIGFPTTYLIDKKGNIYKKYIGTLPDKEGEKEADLQREIERLLEAR